MTGRGLGLRWANLNQNGLALLCMASNSYNTLYKPCANNRFHFLSCSWRSLSQSCWKRQENAPISSINPPILPFICKQQNSSFPLHHSPSADTKKIIIFYICKSLHDFQLCKYSIFYSSSIDGGEVDSWMDGFDGISRRWWCHIVSCHYIPKPDQSQAKSSHVTWNEW